MHKCETALYPHVSKLCTSCYTSCGKWLGNVHVSKPISNLQYNLHTKLGYCLYTVHTPCRALLAYFLYTFHSY